MAVQPTRRRPAAAETSSTASAARIGTALGAEVRALRRSLALSSTDLARQAGLSPAMLSRIESGAAAPSLASLAALADALGVPVARGTGSSPASSPAASMRSSRVWQ